MSLKKIKYHGWNCLRLANKEVELLVTLDVGPRVIRFGFIGGPNEFKEYTGMLGKKGGREWRIYGGHRLWHAPEDPVRTYYPDNEPVAAQEIHGGVLVIQAVEKSTGLQKEMEITLEAKQPKVKVVHRLRNHGAWPVEFAPWALTVMAPGGRCIIPMPPRGEHPRDLLPANTLTLWPYTDMSDPRWTWGNKYVLLRQEADPRRAKPQKIGAWVPDGWAAYAAGGRLFVKTFTPVAGARYPDCGCCFETFTNQDMLEVETVGPCVNLQPGASVEHVERWTLFRNVPTPTNDAEVDRYVLPKVN
jgi:hypothetical protein